jgi:hypothetical protein
MKPDTRSPGGERVFYFALSNPWPTKGSGGIARHRATEMDLSLSSPREAVMVKGWLMVEKSA